MSEECAQKNSKSLTFYFMSLLCQWCHHCPLTFQLFMYIMLAGSTTVTKSKQLVPVSWNNNNAKVESSNKRLLF